MSEKDLTPSEQRVADALAAHALPGHVIVLEELATTAAMAAQALDVAIGQIVKSLVFADKQTGAPVLLLVSGANRVHEKRVGREMGITLARADADRVKEVTGFSIGGVSPLGHTAPIATFMDRDLFGFENVWAAAGHARSVFEIAPSALQSATGAPAIQVT